MADLRVDLIPGVNQGALAASTRAIAQSLAGGTKGFETEMRRIGRIVESARVGATARRQFSEFARAAEAAGKQARTAAASIGKGFEESSHFADELLKDIKAIQQVVASQANRRNSLVDPRTFAELNRVLEKLQGFQRRVRLTDPNDFTAMRKLRTEFQGLAKEATGARVQTSGAINEAIAGARLQSNIEARAARERLVARQTEASQTRFIAQRQQQEILSNTQRTNAIRVQVTRTFLETIGRLERGLGATIAGVARTTAGAVGRIYSDTLGRLSSMFSRTGRQISQIERSNSSSRLNIFRSSMSSQERLLQQSITRQSAIIQRAQQRANTGVIGASRRSTLLGLGGGLAGAGLLSLGLERFSNLERLQRQFEALTGSAEVTRDLLADISTFARETPFDLVGVADLAKGFLAIKTPADQVLTRVRAVADAVALTGGGTVELTRIQRALGQIISAGKLQGDEINQLAESLPGINIREIAANLFGGGSFARFQELNDAGEISGTEFVDGFINALLFDPRMVGASEDLAKTLGGRIANLKEVVADTGAAFIGLIAEPLKQATVIATRALDGLAQFIRGNVTGAFALLRTAVGGAVIAIGGLLIAKTAGEALKVLATSARLLLTPFGAIVVVFGAIGAAFAIMRTRSEEFRDVTDRLASLLGTQFSNVVEAVGTAVDKVRDAFTQAHVPITATADALERAAKPARSWISEIGTGLATAIGVVGRFLVNTLIPALADVAIFIGQRIGPAFRFLKREFLDFARFVAPTVNRGLELIGDGFDFVVERGREVVSAIRDIARGARSALGPGLVIGGAALAGTAVAGPIGAIVAAVAAAFATLSPQIRDSIVNGLTTAREKVVELFRDIDWNGLANEALRFVNRVGFILGSLISDRRFIAALAGIAAAAAAVAVNFVTGFAEGVRNNLDDLADLGKDIGEKIIQGLLDFLSNPRNLLLVGLLGGAFLAGRGLFNIGQQAAQQFSQGFGQGFRATSQQGGGFFLAAFGSKERIFSEVRAAAAVAQDALQTELRRLNQGLGQPGAGGRVRPSGTFQLVTQNDIDTAKQRFQQLESVIGSGAAAGLRFRGAISETFAAIRSNSGGIRGIFSSIGTGIGDAAAALKGQGAAIGTALGVGVIAGFGSAVAGKSLGEGNIAGGLGGILAASLGSFLALGGGPQGLAAAGITAGIGGIAAAITASGQASKKAAADVRGYRDALVSAGGAAAEARDSILDLLLDNLLEESPKVGDAFDRLGIKAQDFLDISALAPEQFKEFSKAISELDQLAAAQGLGDVLRQQRETKEGMEALGLVTDDLARQKLTALVTAFQNGTISQGTFRESLAFLLSQTESLQTATEESGKALIFLGDDASATATNFFDLGSAVQEAAGALSGAALGRAFGGAVSGGFGAATLVDTLKGKVEDAKTAIDEAKTALDKLLNPTAGTFQSAINELILSLPSLAGAISGLDLFGSPLDAATFATNIEALRGQLSDVVKTGIDNGLTESEIDTGLTDLQASITKLDIPEDAKNAIIGEIQAVIDADTTIEFGKFTVDTAAASAAGEAAGTAALGGFRSVKPSSAGNNFASAIAAGIRLKIAAMQSAARAAAQAALDAAKSVFVISSPSKAGLDIGENFGAAMAAGISSQQQEIAFAAQEAARAATDTASEILGKKQDLFGSIFAGDAAIDEAKIRINAGLGAILEPIQRANEAAFSAAQRAAQSDATAEDIAEAQRTAVEAANRSIELNLTGIGNRSAISAAVDNIKNLGREMLDAGSATADVAATMLRTRTDLINFATSLGFSNAEIVALINSLGLSEEAINRFAREADRVQPDIKDPGTDSGKGDTNVTFEAGSVQLALPFGDPNAVALAVGNRIATTVRV